MGSASGNVNMTGNDSCRLRGSFFTPSVFNDFRERGDFFDINLFTDEGSMPAHKVILSACSDFFRDKLRLMQPSWNPGDPLQSTPVMSAFYLLGVSQDDLADILEFIYKGDVQVSLEHLDDFLLVAQRLKIKGLITEDSSPADVNDMIRQVSAGARRVSTLKQRQGIKRAPDDGRQQMMATRKSSRMEREIQLSTHEQEEFEEQDIKNILPVITVASSSSLSAGVKDGELIEEVQEENIQEVDVRFELGDWHLEMGDGTDQAAVELGLEGGDPNDVLINGQKAKTFIKKIDKVFHCQLCDHSSKDKSNLVRHVKRRHTNPSFELCPHCGKTYKNKECLYNHMATKRCMRGITFDPKDPRILSYLRYDPSVNKWGCVECDAKYRQKCNAREHVAVKHIGIQRFAGSQDAISVEEPAVAKFIEYVPAKNKWKCLSCGRLFSTSFNVSHHIKQKHTRKHHLTPQQQQQQMQDPTMSDSDSQE